MPNDYFQFKQFLIKQDKCAMKVCTDACLFGAWLSACSLRLTTGSFLEIGTGTGLLSLMLAQKLPDAIIDTVEIDKAAAQQAQDNFSTSLWNERLHVHYSSIQQFAETTNKKYDVIISNPPFYENDLKSDDAKRNLALHSSDLKLEELVFITDKFLNDDGNFFVLLPYHRTKTFEKLVQSKFFIKEEIFIKQTSAHAYFRTMFWLTKENVVAHQSEITIMNEHNNYTDEFVNFLKDYYLYL